jgi:alkylhydroperoxidase/carboxymuconolactone decarboxylase family protein YurZ
MAAIDPELQARSERYLDELFGPGAGARHSRFLTQLENEGLRTEIHRYHALQADRSQLSVEEHYLIALCVLCAQRSYGTAQMFAKTLRHLGVPRAKILAALGRLAMWVGGIPATEATLSMQRALDDFDRLGSASLAAWFPDEAGNGQAPQPPEPRHG